MGAKAKRRRELKAAQKRPHREEMALIAKAEAYMDAVDEIQDAYFKQLRVIERERGIGEDDDEAFEAMCALPEVQKLAADRAGVDLDMIKATDEIYGARVRTWIWNPDVLSELRAEIGAEKRNGMK